MAAATTPPGTAAAGETGAPQVRDDFLAALRRAAATVTVVTTDGPGGRWGMTVSAMTSVSADPPSLLVCLNRKGPVLDAVIRNRAFAVNLLSSGQGRVARVFAGMVMEANEDRFSGAGAWAVGPLGQPWLEGAAGSFSCTLSDRLDVGTHAVLVGLVSGVALGADQEPLIWAQRGFYGLGAALQD
ncbi:MAG: flavin reductase [Alphaproteobacteria bacterium]|nr:flavin reductase [Alphaproteobacteria bacterium]